MRYFKTFQKKGFINPSALLVLYKKKELEKQMFGAVYIQIWSLRMFNWWINISGTVCFSCMKMEIAEKSITMALVNLGQI